MKKFYILALAAAATATSWANALHVETPVVCEELPQAAAVQRAVQRATFEDVLGSYSWTYNSLLEEAPTGTQQSEIQILTFPGMDEGDVLLSLPQGFIEATVDLATSTLLIRNNQYISLQDGWRPVYFYFKDRDEAGQPLSGMSSKDCVGTIKGSAIIFPDDLVWAIGFPRDEVEECLFLSVDNKFVNLAGGEEEDEFEKGWSDYCTGIFRDGWIICGYYTMDSEGNREYYNGTDYPWEVTVQKSDSDPYLYRIYDPYNAETRPINFGDGGKGAIVFSVEDPDFVIVYPDVYSGYTTGSMDMRCFNLEGYYTARGLSKAEIESGINGYQKSYVANDVVYFNQCRINWSATAENNYVWSQAVAPLMHGSLAMPTTGLENVSLEEGNEPVEYYNLQGIRETNPSNGIYILRRGDKVSKVIMK